MAFGGLAELSILRLQDLGLLQSSKNTFSANVNSEYQSEVMLAKGEFSDLPSFW